ncbi:sulfatase-like hydrolase/transferase [Allorhodopirellula heiligendammensis]|uniref:Arylsulfatase n=1 Tax=Allorhodopirellula heiligendammensis TaxID=2714739 RepID=A0A5C6C577_9BACT|nr:sulfatase-like hydrolase/transferase [Allorhodopirellula heiligendammensis]TWU18701.1 Arylsulfatase [Allorhodopirellula heiligendammensis]
MTRKLINGPMRYRILRLGVRSLICAVLFAWTAGVVEAADKPNIVVFLTDDQGYGDLGCFGSDSLETPNIDRLCKQGMKFSDFYVHQRCSPTRLAFMTGSHAHRAGCTKVIYNKDRIGIHADEVTTPELLKTAGYTTGIVGKWHLGEWDAFNPTRHGFDFFYGFMIDLDQGTGIYRNLKRIESIKHKTDGKHSPKLLDAAIGFIKENKERPFFLYYASPLPHTPWIPNELFKETSRRSTYGDVIREIDWQVGELMNALDEHDIAENTLFVFASDNGPVLGIDGGDAGPYRDGKWTDFEGGIRVPCIMRWPGTIKPGSTNPQITGIIDLLPTFCAIAEVDPPGDRVIDGRSILPYMKSEKVEKPIHESFIVPGSMIRHGQWKLLVRDLKPGGKSGREGKRPSAPAGSLFNLQADPGETQDVSADQPAIVADLRCRMNEAVSELEANSRPIGRFPGADDPKTKKNRKNRSKQ